MRVLAASAIELESTIHRHPFPIIAAFDVPTAVKIASAHQHPSDRLARA
jgi:hypothetical protein